MSLVAHINPFVQPIETLLAIDTWGHIDLPALVTPQPFELSIILYFPEKHLPGNAAGVKVLDWKFTFPNLQVPAF